MNSVESVKFQIIREMTMLDNNRLNITWLCKAAGVSRSGYYNWLSKEGARIEREAKDQSDFQLILEAYRFRGYAKGARSIYMRLLHLSPPVEMNLKKIRRLMSKYNLRCPIRKANPYRRMARAIKTSHVSPNLLNREFSKRGVRSVLLTDITYILFGQGQRMYMSTIIDACTMELLSYVVSQSLEVDFVLETVEKLVAKHGVSLHKETLINSDQGSHYTSHKFIQIIKDINLRQSMSRRANCWDNSPQESFYGHMKDEIDISKCASFEEVRAIIDDWADYYNNDRPQWTLSLLTPTEYYQYACSGVYPLNHTPPATKRGLCPQTPEV